MKNQYDVAVLEQACEVFEISLTEKQKSQFIAYYEL